MKEIEGVNIHNVELEIKGDIDRNLIDIGALTISVDDREFILDVTGSYTDDVEATGTNTTRITCDLEVDEDTFDECPYNITKIDLLNADHNDLEATLYVGGEDVEFDVESITLYFDIDGTDYELNVKEG